MAECNNCGNGLSLQDLIRKSFVCNNVGDITISTISTIPPVPIPIFTVFRNTGTDELNLYFAFVPDPGVTMVVDWGDGNSDSYSYNGTFNPDHIYSTIGDFNVRINFDFSTCIGLAIEGNIIVYPDLTNFIALQYLRFQDNLITSPPDLTGLTALQNIYIEYCPNLNQADIDSVLTYFSIYRASILDVELHQIPPIAPTYSILLAAQTANPQCTFNVDP